MLTNTTASIQFAYCVDSELIYGNAKHDVSKFIWEPAKVLGTFAG